LILVDSNPIRLGKPPGMGIGVGVFLLALGAILAFAVDWKIAALDLHVVGWVLMAAGAVGLVLFFYMWNRRRVPVAVVQQSPVRRPVAQQPLVNDGQVYDGRQYDDPDFRHRRERGRIHLFGGPPTGLTTSTVHRLVRWPIRFVFGSRNREPSGDRRRAAG
jgi:Domain of unknown function (DUF6458)